MAERFHTIQVRAEDAAEVALAIARRFRTLSWKVVRDPKGRGAPTPEGDPDGLRRFLISPSDRGWVTILPSGTPDMGPDSLVAFLAKELETIALWMERENVEEQEHLTYEVYWKNKRIDRQDKPFDSSKPAPTYPTLVDQDLQSLSGFMHAGQKHPKIGVADLPRFYPKYAGDKAYIGRFKKLVTAADYPMLWGSYLNAWKNDAPEAARLESWGHLGFQKEDGRSAAARLTHGDPAARRSAVEALASCSLEEARPGLQAALADDDADVRLAAASVLAARPDKGLAQDLADRMVDEDVRVRIAAAKSLRDMGVPEAAEPLAEVVLEDELEVRRAAAAALSNIAVPAARAALVAASKKDKDPEVRRFAAAGLGRHALPEIANDLVRLLADKDAGVRVAAARSAASAHALDVVLSQKPEAAREDANGSKREPRAAGPVKQPVKLPAKLIDALRKSAKKDKDEEARAAAVRALAALLPADEEARDLAMQLIAAQVKTGDLKELSVKLAPGVPFDKQDKRIVTALLKRLEKQPTADVIVALANQADDRVEDAILGLVPRLWKPTERPTRAQVLALAEARAAVTYALVRQQDPTAIPQILKVLELERTRKAPEDPALVADDEQSRVSTCFAAIEAILDLLPVARPGDVEKVTERLRSWLGEAPVKRTAAEKSAAGANAPVGDPGAAVLRRVALVAYGRAEKIIIPAPVVATPAPVVAAPAKGKGGKPGEVKPAPVPVPAKPVVPPKPVVPALPRPAFPDKAVVAIVRPMLQDVRWPEAALALARQTGPRAVPVLVAALTRSIDREVRLAKKGGYSRRDGELVANHRRGIVLALKELKDAAGAVPVLVRLLTLESLRAGKAERKTESSLLGVTITALQALTNYKFGAEPQRWQEVAAGKLPLVAELPKKAPAPPAKDAKAKPAVSAKGKSAAPAKKPAAKAKPAAAKPAAKKPAKPSKPSAKPSAKKPVKKATVLKLKRAPAKKSGARKASARKAAKVSSLKRLVGALAKGAKRLTQPKRMAAKAARRR